MTATKVRGIRLESDLKDESFMRFFTLVQDAAKDKGSVFFGWSPECHDGAVGDIWCEDLSGWLVPEAKADSFEALWQIQDEFIWSDEADEWQVFARWNEGPNHDVIIDFESPFLVSVDT